MQETSIRTRDALKNRQTELTDELQKMTVRNTEMEYKVAQALKQVEVHSQILSHQASQGIAPGGQPGGDS